MDDLDSAAHQYVYALETLGNDHPDTAEYRADLLRAARAEVAEPKRDPCQSREEAGFQRGYQQGRFDERVEAARAEVAEPGDGRRAFEAGRATGTVEGWADYTNQPDPLAALRERFVALAPPAVVSRIAVWRLLGGSDGDLPREATDGD